MSANLRTATAVLALAAVYFAAGKLGLSLAYIHPSVSAVWPPSGIALAALLLWGLKLWPGVFLGAFFVNIATQVSVTASLGIAAGNSLEALLAAWGVHRFANGARPFERARTALKFILIGPILSTAVSATFGAGSLTAGGFAPEGHFDDIWLTWWLGDAVGELIVAPLLLIWLALPGPELKTTRILEAAGLLATLILAASFVFLLDIGFRSEYVMVLPLLWAAFRFDQRGAVTSAFITSVIALAGTLDELGPFVHPDPHQSLLHLQSFLGTSAMAALILGAVVAENKRAQQRLQVRDAVSRILAASPALKDAASRIVQVLCERARWDLGAFWYVDRAVDQLKCVDIWHMAGKEAPAFESMTREWTFSPGIGLLGRIWQSGKAAWIPEVTADGSFPRAPAALRDGLHSAFGFPVKIADETIGVIECFSREIREPDEHFLQMVSDIGSEMGEFMERKRAESNIAALNDTLAADLQSMSRLQQLGTQFVQSHESGALLSEILEVAVQVSGADMGNVQLFDHNSPALKIAAQRGFDRRFVQFFDAGGTPAACGRAVMSGSRVIVEDVATSEIFAGTEAREVLMSSGVRAVQSTPLISRSGRLIGMISTHYRRPYRPTDRQLTLLDLLARQAADFIERTHTEELLLHNEQRFRGVVESAVDGIITIDEHGIINTLNPAAERIFGYSQAETIGQKIQMLMPEPDSLRHDTYIENYLRTGERKIIGIGRQVQGRRKDGSIVPIDLGVSEARIGETRLFIGILRDITERLRADELLRQAKDDLLKANEALERRVKERTADLERANSALVKTIEEQKNLEEQLRQAQKMEIIGTLAGGIAHDFNNILNIIHGYAALLDEPAESDTQMREALKVINEQINRGASVVRQLLTVARKSETRPAPLDANALVVTLGELVRQAFPETITVSLQLASGLPAVLADANQMSQALLNICVNARDAMPAGGKLTVRTELSDESSMQKRLKGAAGDFVSIVINDTGVGMDPAVRTRIFEPFFTTKGIGEGTGLGLAIVYGVVKEHNGFIEVESDPGHGATFRIYLPVARTDAVRPAEQAETTKKSSRQSQAPRGTVLVVEDDEAMIQLLKRLLPHAGYRTLTAMDGEEAVNLYLRHRNEIDIVLLDLGLPKLPGLEVIRRLKRENAAVKILVVTGYLEPERKAEILNAGVKDCVNKPYSVPDIAERLASLLESP